MTESDKLNEGLDAKDKENMYAALLQIWQIMPSDVRGRFLKEQDCVLCHNCREYLTDLQRQIRHDKMIRQAELAKKEEKAE